MENDYDEQVGALFPMWVFELVSTVPEDAADDKKQENHVFCFCLSYSIAFFSNQSSFCVERKEGNDERKEHINNIAFLSFAHFFIVLPRASGAD